jgi:nucleotide-binding universal stress UspA family protein
MEAAAVRAQGEAGTMQAGPAEAGRRETAMESPGPGNAPRQMSHPSFKNILVAVDGSEQAYDAVRVAARLASALSARLTLMTAYHGPSEALGEPNYSRALADALGEAQRILEDARRAALNVGGPEPQVEWLAGEPAETIVETARAGEYDLVVVGTLGRGRLGAALLGSVSSAVAAQAGRPVPVIGDVLR